MTNVALTDKGGNLRQYLFLALFCGGFLVVYLPVLTSLVRAWGGSDDHSHGFVILPLALYFLWQKRGVLSEQEIDGNFTGLVLALLSLAVFVVAMKGEMYTLSSLSMIFFVWGSVIYLFGYRIFRICLFPLLLLFFMVPVPSQIVAALTVPLQMLVTKVSVGFASLIGIPIYRDGNVIHMAAGDFEVVQACSGLRSIMALLTLGAVYSYWSLRSNLLRGSLFVMAVPIAIVVNIMRVFLLVAVFHYSSVNLSEGTAHTVLGLGVFLAALVLFILVGKGLSVCER